MQLPLVSIIIPTYNRTEKLINRSLPSAINQTYPFTEIIVVGDGTEKETVEAMKAFPNIEFVNLPRTRYPKDKLARWQVGGAKAINWGLDHCKGEWVTFLGDDDALYPDFVQVLLAEALYNDWDFVYGVAEVTLVVDETPYFAYIGEYPPKMGGMVGSGLWKASMGYRYDVESWKKNLPCDWELYSRMLEDGVRFGFFPRPVYKYYPGVDGGYMVPALLTEDDIKEDSPRRTFVTMS